MQSVSTEFLQSLLLEQTGPCLSLYQTTHRSHPEKAQDPIRFKNLVKTLEESLAKSHKEADYKKLLAPFHAIAEDSDFWRHTLDGLVVLSNAGQSHVLRLQRKVPDFAVVADSWHIKPLLRLTQTADNFQVLCLTRQDIHLYEGHRYALDSIPLADEVPATIVEALGDQYTAPYQKVSSYGLGPAGGPGSAMRHGHGDKSDEVEGDILRFFRLVESGLFEKHSKPSGLPLILAALPEYQGIFRKLSNNTHLLPEGISTDPASLSVEQLQQRAWEIMKPVFDARVTALIKRYRQAHGTGLATDDIDTIFQNAIDGRIDTLLVDADHRIPGRLDLENKQLILANSFSDPDVDDLLDDISELALRRKSAVMVIPSELMPSQTGLAAIYRY